MIYLEFENEVEATFDFDPQEVTMQVVRQVLNMEKCPFEDVMVNVLLTDNEGIREYNREYRNIDKETDVLSFPNLEFDEPGIYEVPPQIQADCMDFDTGALYLGDIILSKDRIFSQAEEYGHSPKRELAFLVAHSMLHLSGYDHMEAAEAHIMEQRQEMALTELGITRDI